MDNKEIKDWVSLANSTEVNKALASELLMPYEEDHIMLERCFRAWMEQMLVDVINTARDTINKGDNTKAWWTVNHFEVMVGHDIYPDKDKNIKTVRVDVVFPSYSVIEMYKTVAFNIDKIFTVENAKPFTDPHIWYYNESDMGEELGDFPYLLKGI